MTEAEAIKYSLEIYNGFISLSEDGKKEVLDFVKKTAPELYEPLKTIARHEGVQDV